MDRYFLISGRRAGHSKKGETAKVSGFLMLPASGVTTMLIFTGSGIIPVIPGKRYTLEGSYSKMRCG
jgi:hypothetical protein